MGDRHRSLGVRSHGQAGHAEDRGLLLDPARVRDDDRGSPDERHEVDVPERFDDAQPVVRDEPVRLQRRAATWVERDDDRDAIGDRAASAGLTLHELSSRQASLEDAFIELTHETVEYEAAA